MSLVQPLPAQNLSHIVCPQCGSNGADGGSDEISKKKILELEAQIRRLNIKAAASADKLADYEDELHVLRAKAQSPIAPAGIISPPPDASHPAPYSSQHSPPAQNSSRLSSLSSLISQRRAPASPPPNTPGFPPNSSTHSLPVPLSNGHNNDCPKTPGSPEPATDTLTTMLQAEKKARLAAESSLSEAHSELEELTAQLFGQANEMVANERKARAKLEERVEVLEKRDGDKKKRLERLEKAMGRIERVRGLVG